jgi:hypothetical protein
LRIQIQESWIKNPGSKILIKNLGLKIMDQEQGGVQRGRRAKRNTFKTMLSAFLLSILHFF